MASLSTAEYIYASSSNAVMSAGLPGGFRANATDGLRPDGTNDSAAEQADLATAIAASLTMSSPRRSDGDAWVPESNSEYQTYERQLLAMRNSTTLNEEWHTRTATQNPLEATKEPTEAVDSTEVGLSSDSAGASKSRRNSHLADMIEDMAFRLATEMHMLNDPNGDTYVFIDPPAQQPEQDYHSYQRYRERYVNPLRMQKKKFMLLGTSFFDIAFGPDAQHRVMRRRGLVNRLPKTIKYVLDLTPSTEGDFVAYLTAELCCPEGVRNWYQAGQRWNVSRMLIGGQEEYAAPFRLREECAQKVDDSTSSGTVLMDVERAVPPSRSGSEVTTEQQVVDSCSPVTTPKKVPKNNPIPLEYSPVRHRSAIERVLHAAVENLDPQIDSAPKLWTTFVVAKQYGIKRSALTDYIVRWLRASPNSYFLEVLPETSLKISDGLECLELCRDTFAILVGEEALANVYRCRKALPGGRTVHGRKRGDLPETYQTRVEYASKAFMERITAEFETLADERMSWVDDLPEFRKLFIPELSHALDRPDFSILMINLKAYVRGRIYWILCNECSLSSGPLADSKSDVSIIEGRDLFPTTRFHTTWRQLRPRERIFTRSFWKLLNQSQCHWQASNVCGASGYSVPKKNWPSVAKEYEDEGLLREVKREYLDILVGDCNSKYREHPQVIAAQDVQAASPPSSPSSSIRPRLDGFGGLSNGFGEMSNVFGGGSEARAPTVLPIRTQQATVQSQLRELRPKPLSEQASSSGVPIFGISTGVQGNVSLASLGFTRASQSLGLMYPVAAPVAPNPNAPASSLATEWPTRTSPFAGWTRTSYDPDLYEGSSQVQVPRIRNPTAPHDFFSLTRFFNQAQEYLDQVCSRILASPDASIRRDTLELMLTDTLVCLEDDEWKYLPLWAGGNDDGSGGVFDDQIPLAHAGFSTAGPRVHTGVGSTAASSEFEVISNQTDGSTHHTSTVVNDGFTDKMDRRRVYDADSVWSDVMADKDHDVESARSKTPDTATIHGSEAGWGTFMIDVNGAATGQARTVDKGKGKMVDDEEMFDDVFMQEDDDDDDDDDEDGCDDSDIDDDDMVMV